MPDSALHLPDQPLQALCHCLENQRPDRRLRDALLARLDQEIPTGVTGTVAEVVAANPEQVAAALETIAELASTQDAAAPRVRAFREELSELRRLFADRPAIRVFVQISPRPLYTVGEGQLTDSLLEICGGRKEDAERLIKRLQAALEQDEDFRRVSIYFG